MSLTAAEHRTLVSYPIDVTGAATHTIRTPTTGTRFVLYALHLQAAGATNLTLLSGAVAISGTQGIVFTGAGEKDYGGQGIPIAVGRAAGEAFKIVSSGAVDLDGWALIAEVPG